MKTITLEYNGKAYELTFTRKTVARLEQEGLTIQALTDKPVSTIPHLFHGAFYAKCSYVKRELANEIYDSLASKDDLISALGEMYAEPIEALMAEPKEKEGNATWKVNW